MAGHDDHHRLPPVDPRIEGAAREGCPEARLKMSRRSMLGVTASLFSSAFVPGVARAATDPDARFLVVLLRGGMDGINVLVPKLDPRYATVRRQIAIPFANTLSLGADFGLHPGLRRVYNMFNAGDAAFVPAVGIPLRNRSHFECQDNLENGLPGNTPNATGWLNRLLGALPAGDPVRVHGGIEIGSPPLILRGREPVLGWSPTWFEKGRSENLQRLKTVYNAVDPALWPPLFRGVMADRMATAAGAGSGNVDWFRQNFIGAARLMSADAGPRIAVLTVEGWDTHANEGGLSGDLNNRLRELDQALADFKTEMAALWAKTVVICVTEFGRTVLANGGRGTDHGIASLAILVGGAVRKGFVGDWPGLAPRQLYDGDLRPTSDMRGVFKGILRDHLGVPTSVINSTVFPGSDAVTPVSYLVKTPRPASSPAVAAASAPPPTPASPIERYRARYGAA